MAKSPVAPARLDDEALETRVRRLELEAREAEARFRFGFQAAPRAVESREPSREEIGLTSHRPGRLTLPK